MEITGKGPGISLEAYVTQIKDNKAAAAVGEASAAAPAAQQDKVVLSPEAREVQEAKRQLEAVPDIRTEKVAELRQRIESGTYQVEGDRVAVRMISESLVNTLL